MSTHDVIHDVILDMPDSAIDKILDVNVKSAIALVREARPHLRKVGALRLSGMRLTLLRGRLGA